MPSLFTRLTRYRPLYKHGQRENQHTEALAAVLEACPDLCWTLVRKWLPADAPPLAATPLFRVQTQAPAGGRDRVDLQIAAGPLGVPDVLVWVEIKVDAGLSGSDQLHNYQSALEAKRVERCRLVHLTRSADVLAAPPRPERTLSFTWQQVAETVGAASSPGSARWLERQLVQFLEEGGLAVTRPLSTADVLVAEGQQESTQLWGALLEAARQRINRKLGVSGEVLHGRPVDHWPSLYYVCLPRAERSELGPAYREWTIRPWDEWGRRLWFGAGVTVEGQHREVLEAEGHFEASGFKVVETAGGWIRIFRWRSAGDIAAFPSLEDQIEALSKWAAEAMNDAAAALAGCHRWQEPQ